MMCGVCVVIRDVGIACCVGDRVCGGCLLSYWVVSGGVLCWVFIL